MCRSSVVWLGWMSWSTRDGRVSGDGGDAVVTAVTKLGGSIAEKLIAERRATLSRLLEGWDPERNVELAGLLTRLADEVGARPGRELVGR